MTQTIRLTSTRSIQINDPHYLLTDTKYNIHDIAISYEEALMEHILHLTATKRHSPEDDSFYIDHNLRINDEH